MTQAAKPEIEGTALSQEVVNILLLPPGGGPGGKSCVSFCSAVGPTASGTKILNERAVPSHSGLHWMQSGSEQRNTSSLPASHHATG